MISQLVRYIFFIFVYLKLGYFKDYQELKFPLYRYIGLAKLFAHMVPQTPFSLPKLFFVGWDCRGGLPDTF
jgi:hypothetical protein